MGLAFNTSRVCKQCGLTITSNRRVYCSSECSKDADKARIAYPGIPAGTVGAVGELLVSAELLSKGYSVYRSVSPHSPFDLVACKNGEMVSIEVKTGQVRQGGSLSYHKGQNSQEPDHYAVVFPGENRVIFVPELAV